MVILFCTINPQVKPCPCNKLHCIVPALCSVQRRGEEGHPTQAFWTRAWHSLGRSFVSQIRKELLTDFSLCEERDRGDTEQSLVCPCHPEQPQPAILDAKIEVAALTSEHLNANFSF